MLKNYLKIAFRNIRRNFTYSFINIFGLAVGLASAWLTVNWQSIKTALKNPIDSLRTE